MNHSTQATLKNKGKILSITRSPSRLSSNRMKKRALREREKIPSKLRLQLADNMKSKTRSYSTKVEIFSSTLLPRPDKKSKQKQGKLDSPKRLNKNNDRI